MLGRERERDSVRERVCVSDKCTCRQRAIERGTGKGKSEVEAELHGEDGASK